MAPIMSWTLFESAFMGRFFPHELSEAKVREFFTLMQESMSVHQCNLMFTQLSHYAFEMVADIRSRMSLFVSQLSRLSSRGNANQSSFQQNPNGPAPSSSSAPTPTNKDEFRNQNSQNLKARPT
ncbi:hypothetical protein H5410_036520 [Solanum commersonii]|uniref:Retrotransposon gag domain-containing protein n=1 Tax=Solanum commersonii TaxID=4109 RepID=A0A9J5Y6S5_SOLCO|nr:hypothetical protein H5410_036520 [Solanum commersonii]